MMLLLHFTQFFTLLALFISSEMKKKEVTLDKQKFKEKYESESLCNSRNKTAAVKHYDHSGVFL